MSDADVDRLIERWAASQAPELIAAAQAEALNTARARLEARLVDALLAAADARLAGERRERAATASSDTLVWLYGVTDRPEPPVAEGVDGHAVQVHEHAGVNALFSHVPRERFSEDALRERLEDLESVERLARAHDGVLEAALAAGAVVPVRLCTVYSSLQALDTMLEREARALTAALDRLDGMQEWGVKAFLRAPVPAAPADEAASGTDYLTKKRERREAAEAGREATETAVAQIHARLTEGATTSTVSRTHDRRLSGRDAEMVLNAAYLVPIPGVAAFRAIVEDLARRHEAEDLELELTGPWPPYHFVETPGHGRPA